MNWVTFSTRMPSGAWELRAAKGAVEICVTPLTEGRRHHEMTPGVARAIAAQFEACATEAESQKVEGA